MSTVIDIPAQGRIEGIRLPLGRFSQDDEASASGAVTAYLGIPFAQPPVGPLRWKRPQRPAPAWRNGNDGEDVRKSRWQADPVQDLVISGFFSRARRDSGAPSPLDMDGAMDETVDEDCLYLNIWVPEDQRNVDREEAATKTKLPVLVWVYGGAFVVGAASSPTFDGARLAHESGCIVVSVTYRVGVLGFLGSWQLAKAEANGTKGTGNYGLWDLIAGFEWIQESIAAFGGDASNVTAFGESAGAISLHALLVSSATPPNLFARACLESGTALTLPPRTLPSAQATFEAIAKKLGALDQATDDEKLDVMNKASPRQLLAAVSALPQRRPRTEYMVNERDSRPSRRMDIDDQWSIEMDPSSLFAPIWDGVLIDEAYLQNAIDGIPGHGFKNAQKGIILGCTADEGTLFSIAMSAPESLKKNVDGFHPQMRRLVEVMYGTNGARSHSSVYEIASAYMGDNLFIAPVMDLMARLAQHMMATKVATPAYGYIHSHRPSEKLLRGIAPNEETAELIGKMGALHTTEIPFVFGNDGSQEYSLTRSKYQVGDADPTKTKAEKGFTCAEKSLSLEWMRCLARFARGQAPWKTLVDSTTRLSIDASTASIISDVQVRLLGNMPRLGATTERARATVEAASNGQDRNARIPIVDGNLGNALMWSEPVVPSHLDATTAQKIGSAKEKHALWTDECFKNLLLAYYGDERIRYIPFKLL